MMPIIIFAVLILGGLVFAVVFARNYFQEKSTETKQTPEADKSTSVKSGEKMLIVKKLHEIELLIKNA